jgi:hypothetical protein
VHGHAGDRTRRPRVSELFRWPAPALTLIRGDGPG